MNRKFRSATSVPPRQERELTAEVLRAWPLPRPAPDGDKEERGRLLIVGGSTEIPGAVLLAANAAFRAGAGKVTVGIGSSLATAMALAIPELRVIALPETEDGGISPSAIDLLSEAANRATAILIGPGMQNEEASRDLVCALLERTVSTNVILDALAMGAVHRDPGSSARPDGAVNATSPSGSPRILLTPHAGEVAHLTGMPKEEVISDPGQVARQLASRWNAVVAVKGASTWIASPDGQLLEHAGGNIGLAASGSGDCLAGVIAGLAARGSTLEQACAWGVFLHARAGDRLVQKFGPLGFFARELAAEIPALMNEFDLPPA